LREWTPGRVGGEGKRSPTTRIGDANRRFDAAVLRDQMPREEVGSVRPGLKGYTLRRGAKT